MRDSLEGSHVIAPAWVWGSAEGAPHTGVLAERVRAKYYGGVVIVYRPFLRMILEDDVYHATHGTRPAPLSPPLVMQYAERCVEALVQSTRVFHNVDDDNLVLSNPWGTAYA